MADLAQTARPNKNSRQEINDNPDWLHGGKEDPGHFQHSIHPCTLKRKDAEKSSRVPDSMTWTNVVSAIMTDFNLSAWFFSKASIAFLICMMSNVDTNHVDLGASLRESHHKIFDIYCIGIVGRSVWALWTSVSPWISPCSCQKDSGLLSEENPHFGRLLVCSQILYVPPHNSDRSHFSQTHPSRHRCQMYVSPRCNNASTRIPRRDEENVPSWHSVSTIVLKHVETWDWAGFLEPDRKEELVISESSNFRPCNNKAMKQIYSTYVHSCLCMGLKSKPHFQNAASRRRRRKKAQFARQNMLCLDACIKGLPCADHPTLWSDDVLLESKVEIITMTSLPPEHESSKGANGPGFGTDMVHVLTRKTRELLDSKPTIPIAK